MDSVTDNGEIAAAQLKPVTLITCYKCGAVPQVLHIDMEYRRCTFGGRTIRGGREQPMCEACAADRLAEANADGWVWLRFYSTLCDYCERELKIHHRSRRRRHHFCTDKCQQDYYNSLAAFNRSQERGTRACEACSDTFTPRRTDSKYCSGKCRQKAYRQRGAI